MPQGDIRIGVSGWTYAPWRGEFYPEDLPQKRELAFASEAFRAIEINGTFYGLQKPDAFARSGSVASSARSSGNCRRAWPSTRS